MMMKETARDLLRKYERYLEVVRNKSHYLKVLKEADQANWSLFFLYGQPMAFSQRLGSLIADLLKIRDTNCLIEQIFGALESEIEEEDDLQSTFIKLISTIIFQTSSLGDDYLADTLEHLFLSRREESWAQCLLVQIVSGTLQTGHSYAVNLSSQRLSTQPLYQKIVKSLSKEVGKQPSRKRHFLKH